MRLLTFPNWFEDEAVREIVEILELENVSERAYKLPDDFPEEEWLIGKITMDDRLERAWIRSKSYYPDSPDYGQVQLWSCIVTAYFYEKNWATDPEAKRWKNKLDSLINSLANHWEEIPANFYCDMHIDERPDLDFIVNAKFQWRKLPGLSEMRSTAANLIVKSAPHGVQVRGEKARRRYFVRSLSTQLKTLTGQWKREIVAEITSVIFECEFTAPDVIRATKGMDQTTLEDDELLHFRHVFGFAGIARKS
ncbi:MAG: hypothetical protein RJQ10_10730 [Haliea sp.]|uniref:hypothetical protein n=1 Tax=Haliea sp. TaxID=1932666 RepID=UPI0032F09291